MTDEVKCMYCNDKLDDLYASISMMSLYHLRCLRNEHLGEIVLKKCVFCGNDLLVWNSCDKHICKECYPLVVRCEYCGNWVKKYEAIKYDNRYYCESCYSKGFMLIHDYNYTPKLNFYGKQNGVTDLFMGIELEVDLKHDNNFKHLLDIDQNYFFIKGDGSLPSTGVEIISHPITFEYLKYHNDIIKKNIIALSEHGVVSGKQSNCGLHIHLSKNVFGNFHLWKFMTFIYSKTNRAFLTAFSGRNSSNMLSWSKISTKKSDTKYRAKHKQQGCIDRHHAVNLLRNETVELRIFEGTLEEDRLWAYIEFTKALFEYTKITDAKGLTINKFLKFLKGDKYNQKYYKNCINYMEKTEKALTEFSL